MKQRLESPREFNTPAEMLARATFLATLAMLAFGLLLTVAGVVAWQPHWLAGGLAAVGFAWAGRAWLRRRGELEPVERAFNGLFADERATDGAPAAQLLSLLERWEAMEEKRGTAEFDPWELQALRNEIRAVVASDPALEALFMRLQRAA